MANQSNQHGPRAVVMSNWQHTLMVEAVEQGGITLDRMLQLKQGTSGSVMRRHYFEWDVGQEMFVLTQEALQVMERFDQTDISRKSTYAPLSSFIKDRSVLKLAEQRRAELKEAYRKQQAKEKESEGDRVKRARVKMKTNRSQA